VVPAELEAEIEPVVSRRRGMTTVQPEFDDAFIEAALSPGRSSASAEIVPWSRRSIYVKDEFFRRHASRDKDSNKRHAAAKKAFERALNKDATLRGEYTPAGRRLRRLSVQGGRSNWPAVGSRLIPTGYGPIPARVRVAAVDDEVDCVFGNKLATSMTVVAYRLPP
jgi:hypothetical protein